MAAVATSTLVTRIPCVVSAIIGLLSVLLYRHCTVYRLHVLCIRVTVLVATASPYEGGGASSSRGAVGGGLVGLVDILNQYPMHKHRCWVGCMLSVNTC